MSVSERLARVEEHLSYLVESDKRRLAEFDEYRREARQNCALHAEATSKAKRECFEAIGELSKSTREGFAASSFELVKVRDGLAKRVRSIENWRTGLTGAWALAMLYLFGRK